MTSQSGTSESASLRLRPFPAMRFDATRVGDIGAVTSPPYDVMDRPMIERLLAKNPRNIVRLVLPRMVGEPVGADEPYVRAAKLLARWRAEGVLRTDPTPALYVYEYGDRSHRVCGIVGALELCSPASRVVLPHEDVFAPVVADRLAMMDASDANLEPILLVYDGAGSTRDLLDRVRAADPITDVTVEDGTFHRVWSVTDPASLELVQSALQPHSALIADGHHRYATYRRLCRRRRDSGCGAGPWDRGLALLIDQSQFPLRLEAIHRSVSELPLDAVTAPDGLVLDEMVPFDGSSTAPPNGPGVLVLTDGSLSRQLFRAPRNSDDRSDVELLHSVLLPAWRAGEDRIGYHHTVEQTLRSARQDSGLAVLLYPPSVGEVMAVARAGSIMPRKSTSFGPKPRTGLVMRSFEDEL